MRTKTIIEKLGLGDLYREAGTTGKWFHSRYADLWFSSSELESALAAGRFHWSVENWELRDPLERLDYLQKQVKLAVEAELAFRTRLLVKIGDLPDCVLRKGVV